MVPPNRVRVSVRFFLEARWIVDIFWFCNNQGAVPSICLQYEPNHGLVPSICAQSESLSAS